MFKDSCYSKNVYEICKVDEVNQLYSLKSGEGLEVCWQKLFDQLKRLVTHDVIILTKMLFEGHFYDIKSDRKLELVLHLVMLDDIFVPDFLKVLRADEEIGHQMVLLEHQFQLIINLILDNLRSLLDLSLIFILDAAVSQKLLGLNLKIEELWELHPTQFLLVITLILGKAMINHL